MKDLNKKFASLKKKAKQFNDATFRAKELIRRHQKFHAWLLQNNRVTREEMKPFFPKYKDVKK